jgi:hypothetical protein
VNFLIVHEYVPTIGHCFTPGNYDTLKSWHVFIGWCAEQYGNPYGGEEVKWHALATTVTILGDSDALYVKLRWDTMEKPR